VFDKALQLGKYLEINSLADRLDLNDVNARAAVRKGLKLLINTDSHAKEGLANMYFGIATARRGWCEQKDILNTLALKQFEKVFLKG
jgi:DNA polymerase (family 10)